jgi:leader peptidase (prepilin peptidase)/N-methyltransferase
MILAIVIAFGLITGSFLNVVIHRLPRGESLILPPSHCPKCDHRLGFWDLIPVLSYLCLRARCRYCRAPVSPRYPLVELLTAAITLLTWLSFGPTLEFAAMLLLSYALIAIAFIDIDHQIIPNKLTLPLLAIGLLFRGIQGEILPALLDVVISGGVLFAFAFFYPQGMGMGDVKYLAMTGAFLGWFSAIYSLFLGSLLGLLVMVPLLAFAKIGRRDPFPFGPFLVLGTLIVLYGWRWLPLFSRF